MQENPLAVLERLLPQSGGKAYSLFELHGYLTAIAVSPELVNPGIWMGRIFGPAAIVPAFPDPGDSEKAIAAIMEYYNSVMDALDDGSFAPVMAIKEKEGETGKDAGPWCRGFVDGLLCWAGSRFRQKDSDFAKLLMPIMYFAEPSILATMKKEMTQPEVTELEELWINMVPQLVVAIQQYVKPVPEA